ncbi:MAG: YncE family protein [Bacteroidetes bacterium]|nr:YncE family protein [Bacteroidota bacterium]MBV6462459.1 hypothetical protein [Flavobacteriales bacterium]WKZ74374.1 MAG: hypothetical protein QY303_09490 [Vicingaceae bacterium]MCL4817005.1 hypothetical protein [Flavobacteriales bacterium]NOG94684.1 YncE family protein [Bacteroidota bacterium]
MSNKRGHNLFIFLVMIVFLSCRKDKPADKIKPNITIQQGGVFISNEGNFQFGNAKISYYNPSENTVSEDVFETANNRPLGDVCQSVYFYNSKAYVVVNNSGKIEVVNEKTFVSTAIINGFVSPRYFLPISNAKAFVTDLYANKIYVVDLTTNQISGNIPVGGWCEEMTMVYGKVFITSKEGNYLYVADAINDLLIDSIQIGFSSNSIVQDKNAKLWVLCDGNQTNSIYPSLHRINPANHLVEQSFQFSSINDAPWRLKLNGSADTLYFLNKGVYKMSILENTIPSQPFISSSGSNFYGLGINPENSEIYVSDAIDYVQKGQIYRYTSSGSLINTFKAGIIPSDFYFR